MDFESEEARRFGGLNRWHHLECFLKLREELNFLDPGTSLNGFSNLRQLDKDNVQKLLPGLTTKTTK